MLMVVVGTDECLHIVFGEIRVAVFMKILSLKPVLAANVYFLESSSTSVW